MNKHTRSLLVFGFILAGLLLSAAAFSQSGPVTLSVPTLTAAANSAVDIPITAAGANGIGAMHIELVYDPAVLTWESVTAGALAQGSLIDAGAETPGRLVIALATVNSLNGAGQLAVARFKVVGAGGQTTALALEKTTAWEGTHYREIQVVTQPGKLTVNSPLPLWLILAAAALCLLLLFGVFLIILLRALRRPKPVPAAGYPRYAAPPPGYSQPMPRSQPQGQRPRPPVQPPPQTVHCPRCGAPNQAGARFCNGCGQQLQR